MRTHGINAFCGDGKAGFDSRSLGGAEPAENDAVHRVLVAGIAPTLEASKAEHIKLTRRNLVAIHRLHKTFVSGYDLRFLHARKATMIWNKLTVRVLLICAAAAPVQRTARAKDSSNADHKVSASVEVRACTDAQVSAIFGSSKSGCVIYNVQTGETKLEIDFCSGFFADAGIEVGVGTAKVGGNLVLCTKLEIPLRSSDSRKPSELLKDPAIQKKVEESMTGAIKAPLHSVSTDDLKLLGFDVGKLDSAKVCKMGEFTDKSDKDNVKAAIAQVKASRK